MFCVECGKDTEIYKDGTCIECYLKSHKFTKGPEIIKIEECPHCGNYKHKNTWKDILLNEIIINNVKHYFKINRELKKIDINPVCKEINKGYDCIIYITGYIKEKEITEEHKLEVKINKISCETCSKQFGGYHEAIIQVRSDNRKLTDEEINEIQQNAINHVEKIREKGNKSLFIADISIEHGGIDFFISDKQDAMSITKKLQESHGGQIKTSSSNVGMKDSKQIYRMTYLLRIPDYKVGDYLKINDSYYRLIKIKKHSLNIFNLLTWNEETIDLKNVNNLKIFGSSELIFDKILVSQNKNEVQVMDPKTYDIKIIKKPKDIKLKSKNIKIINLEDKLFLKK